MSVRVLVLGLLIQQCNIFLPFAPRCSPQETFTSKGATLRDSKPRNIWVEYLQNLDSENLVLFKHSGGKPG